MTDLYCSATGTVQSWIESAPQYAQQMGGGIVLLIVMGILLGLRLKKRR